jgi:hypothetical protein
MRYKNNVLDKLIQVDATVAKIEFGVNRNFSQNEILSNIDQLKEQLENVKSMINIEPDDLERQF